MVTEGFLEEALRGLAVTLRIVPVGHKMQKMVSRQKEQHDRVGRPHGCGGLGGLC